MHIIPTVLHVVLALMVLWLPSSAAAQEKTASRDALTLSLSANLAPAPARVSARIRVEPDPRSRALFVEWWTDDGLGGSHMVELDGDRASARQDYDIRRMEPGEYIVSAVLLRSDGSQVRKRSQVIVVGEGTRFTVGPNVTDLMAVPSGPRGR
jgi:hypothetical protein